MRNSLKYLFFLFVLSLIFLFSCTKSFNQCKEGIVKDFTGFDGCGKLIILNDGTKLEPVSLPQGTVLVPDKKVCVAYKIRDAASFCMTGITVQIISLTYTN